MLGGKLNQPRKPETDIETDPILRNTICGHIESIVDVDMDVECGHLLDALAIQSLNFAETA